MQSGGTNSAVNLSIGTPFSSSSGTYSLNGPGILIATNENVGSPGIGLMSQTGGANSATALVIGGQGRYQFSGGTLKIAELANQGVFDVTNCTGLLSITGSQIVDLSQAVLVNTGSMSLSVGPGSLVLVPAGFNPAAFGSYNNLGTIHYPGTPILVSSGQAYTGAFSVNDMLTCQGALSVVSGGSINLNSGVLISGTGNANLGNGAYFVENAASGIQGGSLTASYGYVGYSGTGTFNQVAGTNTDSGSFFNGGVFLGYNAGANGTYNLSGTATLSTYTEAVGYNGVGTFNQSGGQQHELF